ncbi:DNA polymerase ligase N-terminal domain-containing protein [Candidatus Laterigemmans baculatus]|uniref:DNA polymerase ligase N-terminal domain-containing protein n=1 Tax=Candidatus Laterigemmans baculatus TaxID=2770505 RepID=UPI0013D8EC84|nr:DNA polymerase ligase N-terminal domain-containing protein [Candidatus Laterigemmans baculatus]
MPRFVFLRHEVPASYGRRSHFDLMFEVEGQLRTWAVDQLPTLGGPAVVATPLPPHRIAYLDYEGPVSENRGSVRRVARGTCRGPLAQGVEQGENALIAFEIESPELQGRIVFAGGEVWLEENESAAGR